MTAQARRPGPVPVALAALCAALNVWSFSQVDWNGVWGGWFALFLTEELWAAWARTGGTLSERLWAWLGIRPRRPWRQARIGAAGVFVLEFGAHIVTGGAFWWSGSLAIAGTAAPVVVVVAYALLREREGSVGLGKLVSDVKLLLKLREALGRLREAGKMGKLKAVLWGLVGAVGTGVVAQVSGACPGLLSQASPILLAGVGGAIAYFAQRPLSKVGAKVAGVALLGGALAAAGTAAAQVIDQVCGGGFVKSIPSLAAAGAWLGFMLWLRPDRTLKAPDLGSVKPTAPKY